MIQNSHKQLSALQEQLILCLESLVEQPTAIFWSTFLQMSYILHKFIWLERSFLWIIATVPHSRRTLQIWATVFASLSGWETTWKQSQIHPRPRGRRGWRANGKHNSVSLSYYWNRHAMQMPGNHFGWMALPLNLPHGWNGSTQNTSLLLFLQSWNEWYIFIHANLNMNLV